MFLRRAAVLVLLLLAAPAGLAACGQTCALAGCAPQTTTPAPTPTPTATPAPDSQTVSVLATGVGSFALAAIPVAIVHNDAAVHAAEGVIVHFVTHRAGGATLGALDSVPVNLVAGESLPVAANCTDACNNAVATNVTVSVGTWVSSHGAAPAGGSAAYRCGTCRGGHGYGEAGGTVSAPGLAAGAGLVLFAECENAAGAIVGAGTTQLVWPGGSSLAVSVPVVVNDPPAKCQLGASTGW
jgi:hypothetical protein